MQIFRTTLRKLIFITCGILLFATAFMFAINAWINANAKDKLFSSTEQIPKTYAAIVLGTSHRVIGGNDNLYFTYRIQSAVDLFNAGIVEKILVSGDNGTMQYNEPREMRKALIKLGVPDSCIVLDFAGFRTFDSVVRAREVFGLDTFIIISQQFHLQRALFIAQAKDITAYGYIAQDPGSSLKTNLREYPARVSAFIDCYILHAKPKYLGEKIII